MPNSYGKGENEMPYHELLNIVVTLAMSIWWFTAYTRVYLKKYEQDAKIDGVYEAEHSDILRAKAYLRAVSYFTVISGTVLTFGFAFLFLIQSDAFPNIPFLGALISSGLHVPFFLALYGYLIKGTFRLLLKKDADDLLRASDAKTIIYVNSLSLNICMCFIDWKMGLFVVAILLGKHIWIDAVYDGDSLRSSFKSFVEEYHNEEITTATFLSMRYSAYYVMIFLMYKIAYHICVIKYGMPPCYIVFFYGITFAGYKSMIGRLQIEFGRDTLNRCKGK